MGRKRASIGVYDEEPVNVFVPKVTETLIHCSGIAGVLCVPVDGHTGLLQQLRPTIGRGIVNDMDGQGVFSLEKRVPVYLDCRC